MKTIMIRDDVYKKLVEIKGDRSFSDIIDYLIRESKEIRNKKIEKYFGILNNGEKEILEKEINSTRKELNEAFGRYFSSD